MIQMDNYHLTVIWFPTIAQYILYIIQQKGDFLDYDMLNVYDMFHTK